MYERINFNNLDLDINLDLDYSLCLCLSLCLGIGEKKQISPKSYVARHTSHVTRYRLFVKSWCRFSFSTSRKVEDFTLMVNCQPLR